MVDAFRIATGDSSIPREWIDMLVEDEREASKWKTNEFRREFNRTERS